MLPWQARSSTTDERPPSGSDVQTRTPSARWATSQATHGLYRREVAGQQPPFWAEKGAAADRNLLAHSSEHHVEDDEFTRTTLVCEDTITTGPGFMAGAMSSIPSSQPTVSYRMFEAGIQHPTS